MSFNWICLFYLIELLSWTGCRKRWSVVCKLVTWAAWSEWWNRPPLPPSPLTGEDRWGWNWSVFLLINKLLSIINRKHSAWGERRVPISQWKKHNIWLIGGFEPSAVNGCLAGGEPVAKPTASTSETVPKCHSGFLPQGKDGISKIGQHR
jgi:hypothetical protein